MSKKTLYFLVAAVLVLSAICEMSGVHLHSPAWWPLPFGYDIFFGFFGCWILIITAKLIMTPLLQRDENYYDDKDGGEQNE